MRYSIINNENNVVFTIPVNGIKKEDIDINQLEKGIKILTKKDITIPEEYRTLHKEFITQEKLELFIPLTDELELDSIQAKIEEGILTLSIEKKAESLPKKISII